MNTPFAQNASNNDSSQNKKFKALGLSAVSGGPSRSEDAKVNFSSIWSTVKRTKWLILVTCLLVTGAVTGYTLTLPKVYESTAIVSVSTSAAARSAGVMAMQGNIELSKEIGLLQNSGELSRRIAARLYAIADTASTVNFTLFRPVDGQEATLSDVMSRLQERVSFTGMNDQSMIRIVASSESPKEAAFIADAYATEYRQFSQELSRTGVVAARSFLEKQVEKRQQEIDAAESEWEQFARTNAVATEGDAGQRVARTYVDLEQQRDALMFQQEQEQRMKAMLEEQLVQLQPSLRSSVLTEQKMQSVRTQIQSLEVELAQLKLRTGQYYANNPSLRGNETQVPELAELTRRIEALEKRKAELTEELVTITEEQGRSISSSGVLAGNAIGQVVTLQDRIDERALNIQQLEGQIRALNNQIASFQGRIAALPRQAVEREQIQRRREQAQRFYNSIYAEYQKTLLAEEAESGSVQVIRAPVVPLSPVSPDLNQNILMGVLLGLGFGIGLGFIVQSMNSRIYGPEDLENHGFNLLGVVPVMDDVIKAEFDGEETIEVAGRTLSTRLMPLLNPWSTLTENYRLMRTNLQYPNGTREGAQPQVILVTSPEPGDGKTTTATNLALTFALGGREVLLVDADLRRPKVHELLGLKKGPGLVELLKGRGALKDFKQVFVDGLSVLSSGEAKVPPAELLDSERMRTILSEFRKEADVIIIDTPPVLAASDALALAIQADATLVVADAEKTTRAALEQVEKTFRGVGVTMSAVILNRLDASSGGYYGYGEKYGEYNSKLQLTNSQD